MSEELFGLNFSSLVLNEVYLPAYVKDCRSGQSLYGYIHDNTRVCNVICDDDHPNILGAEKIGEIKDSADSDYRLVGVIGDEGIEFYLDSRPLKPDYYNYSQDAFSRNTGLVESSELAKKTAIIVGQGSVGGMVSVELAKCGVGNFVLIDTDIIKIHNICRHICNLKDVGKLKVDAVAERILSVNPTAKVTKFTRMIQNIDDSQLEQYMGPDSIVIATCDSRYSDNMASRLAYRFDTPFVSVALWARAATGELFYWIPGMDMPCYECYCGSGSMQNIEPSKQYVDDAMANGLTFEPGLGMDVDITAVLGVKLAIDILSLTTPGYKCRLFGSLKQYTIICNTVHTELGQKPNLFRHPLQVRSFNYEKDEECRTCGPHKDEVI